MAVVFLAVMLTYFLAAWAKVRFGGWDWVTGSTLAWAVLRRVTELATWTLEVPGLLTAAQWAMAILEFAAPLRLLARSDRARVAGAVLLLGFHVMPRVGVFIVFLPLVVAFVSRVPWERLPEASRRLRPRVDVGRPAGLGPTGAVPPARPGR